MRDVARDQLVHCRREDDGGEDARADDVESEDGHSRVVERERKGGSGFAIEKKKMEEVKVFFSFCEARLFFSTSTAASLFFFSLSLSLSFKGKKK